MNITRTELGAAIDEVHKRGLKVTGHLCSVTYSEAIEFGIDNLEHGFFVNTQDDPGKQPNVCPATIGEPTIRGIDPDGPRASALIAKLVAGHVTLTSTLPVFEQGVAGHAPVSPRALAVLTPSARTAYLYARNQRNAPPRDTFANAATAFAHEMALERRFVAAGGMLMAGPDPTGNGGIIPGFGDQRGVELLVEAGFTPEAAIRIATLNGAASWRCRSDWQRRRRQERRSGCRHRQPRGTYFRYRDTELVFKDGVAYDPAKLLESVAGHHG